jgi:protein gp37
MGATTGIQWTDATWNPIRGCSRVSEGCRNCYAESVAKRFSGPGQAYEGLVRIGADGKPKAEWNGTVRFVEEHLLDPLKWRKPRRIFVNSMSDLFHPDVTDEVLDRIFAVMASCGRHTFQILTKRPERMREYLQRVSDRAPAAGVDYESRMRAHFEKYKDNFQEGYSLPSPPTPELRAIYDSACLQEQRKLLPDGTTLWDKGFSGGEYHWRSWPLPNVWLGVSAENQAAADKRIPLLLQVPAAVRFVSLEPLLGPIRLASANENTGKWDDWIDPKQSHSPRMQRTLDWVIVGGESGTGPGIRPMHPDWVRAIRDECVAAGVPLFFKQWGEYWPNSQGNYSGASAAALERAYDDGAISSRVGKKAAGDLLDGVEWHEFPAQGV